MSSKILKIKCTKKPLRNKGVTSKVTTLALQTPMISSLTTKLVKAEVERSLGHSKTKTQQVLTVWPGYT